MHSKASNSITAGDNAFDVIMALLDQLNNLTTKGMTLDLLSDIPHLNLEQPWWDDNSIRDLSVGGKLHYAYGDFTIMDQYPCGT